VAILYVPNEKCADGTHEVVTARFWWHIRCWLDTHLGDVEDASATLPVPPAVHL